MNRRSIVGPLSLIVLGGMFLADNVLPDFEVFKLFSEYWPFLLIAWGGLRLLEVLILAATSRPLPARGLSGGEVFLAVMICIIGSTTFAIGKHAPRIRLGNRGMEIFGETYDYPLAVEKQAGEKPRVVIDHLRGNVRVKGEETKVVRVSGRKTVRAYNKADADKANEQTPLEVTVEGDRILVRTNYDRAPENRRITADLEISVPRGATIEGRGRLGDFDVTEVEGSVDYSSDNAGVRLNRIGGNAKVDVRRSDVVRAVDVKGNVTISGSGRDVELENIAGEAAIKGSFGGNLEFKNVAKVFRFDSRNTELRIERLPGRVSMDLGSLAAMNLVGPVKLKTQSKDVKLEEFTDLLELEIERGDIELRPHSLPLSKIAARCRSVGNIEVVLPPAAKFELSATTDRGETRNDWGDGVKTDSDGRSASMKGKVGTGPTLALMTSRGTITLRKE
ncbi:MAG: DUF4097 family beta strand repeat-containing protein [Bryobacteraceae bacterium]